jgi:hypothetical protein
MWVWRFCRCEGIDRWIIEMGFRKFEVIDVGLVKRLRLMTLTGASMAENLVRVRGGFLKKNGGFVFVFPFICRTVKDIYLYGTF